MSHIVVIRRHFLLSILVLTMLVSAACGAPAASEEAAQPAEAVAPTPTAADEPAVPPSKYKESPAMAALVAAGELPLVDERLPENPYVNVDQPEIGEYTDVVLTLPVESQLDLPVNNYVSTTSSQRSEQFHMEGLVQWKADTSLVAHHSDITVNIEPNLAESWDISDDGKEVTFHLRKGIKWSDGVPFTVDDIMFTWDDIIMSDVIGSAFGRFTRMLFEPGGSYSTAGGVPEFERIDDYTFKVIMQESFPEIVPLFFAADPWPISPVWQPKHDLIKVHPSYTEGATMEDWNAARSVSDKPPVLRAWVPTKVVGDKIVFERNPYYFKVDPEGNQLPYFDTFVMKYAIDGATIALGLASNELWGDFTKRSSQEAGVLKANEELGNYSLLAFSRVRTSMSVQVNLDAPDDSLRALFQDYEFVKALNLGLDEVRMALHTCLICPAYPELHGEAMLKAYPQYAGKSLDLYDRDAALAKFDELGLLDSDGDGFREYPEGAPRAGENIGWQIVAPMEDWDRVRWMEDAGEQFNEMGFEVSINPMDEDLLYSQLLDTGEYEMKTNRSFVWGGWTDQVGFEQALIRGGNHPDHFWPENEGGPNPMLLRTKSSELFDWQKEGMAIRDAYLAGETDLQTAMDQYVAWGQENVRRHAFSRGGVTSSVVVDNELGNVPFFYIPEVREGGMLRASWDYYVAMRMWQWFHNPDCRTPGGC